MKIVVNLHYLTSSAFHQIGKEMVRNFLVVAIVVFLTACGISDRRANKSQRNMNDSQIELNERKMELVNEYEDCINKSTDTTKCEAKLKAADSL